MILTLIVSLLQMLLAHNRFWVCWLVLLGIVSSIFFVTGVTMVTVPLRYRKRIQAEFLHFNEFIVRSGLLSIGNYFTYYGAFLTGEPDGAAQTNAIDPVLPQRMSRYREHEKYSVWLKNGDPSSCCCSRSAMVAIGIGELLIGVVILLIPTVIILHR